jgi:alpha-galactosidase
MKIVYIGAGSHDFGRGQIVDILTSPDFKGKGVTISLVDINEESLGVMKAFADRVNEGCQAGAVIKAHTDRCTALPGADYVIVSVARKRYELWEQDYRVPMAHGVRHVLGENGGPGALFHALRSLKLVIPICQDVERLCPQARLFNFTNPEARVLHAISTLTHVEAYGICHGIYSAIRHVAKALGKTDEEIQVISAGMNHFYRLLSIVDRKTGEELLPAALATIKADTTGKDKLFHTLARLYDWISYPSDSHIGEYLSWGAEFHDGRWHYGMENKTVADAPSPANPKWITREEVRQVGRGEIPLSDRYLQGSGESTVAMICDLEMGRDGWYPAVNILNGEGHIANLPRNGVVEIPCEIRGGKIHPVHVGNIPEETAAFIRPQHAIHNLLTEAYRTHSKSLLLKALLADPCIHGIRQAEGILDDMLVRQKNYLPEFA